METNFKNNLAPAVIELNRINEELQAENERLKAELKKWEDRSKVVKDGCDGEVYEWEDNYYIVTPYLNVFVKGLLKENAKLKCLALHLFKHLAYHEYKDWGSIRDGLPESKSKERCARNADRWRRINERCYEAYRKAKKALREGK